MKRCLVLLAISVLVAKVHCYCRFINPPTGELRSYCEYKVGEDASPHILKTGESREIDCLDITCLPGGLMEECDNYGYVSSYPDRCEVIKDGCKSKVVLKSDPSKSCDGSVVLVGR